ncbi:MAG: tetratricopeptide repeat protein [Bacteroidales bacterium]|nr:tetratricopeptide repeat protein [Bacteroidales bacterium]
MKKLVWWLSGLLFLSPLLLKASPEELIRQANEAYVNGQYSYAIELYESVIEQELESHELYYNLGNAYFKENLFGAAILNYERALKLKPSDENSLFNLEVARTRTIDRINPVPLIFYERWWKNFYSKLSVDGWSWMIIFLLLGFLAAMGAFFFSRTRGMKKTAFGVSLIFAVAMVVSLAAVRAQYSNTYKRKDAIVMVPRATAKSSPGEASPDLFVIHEGSKARITSELGEWYEVRLANGNVGWVKKYALEVI